MKTPKTKIRVDVPTKVVDIVDVAAARQLVTRASWIRSAILARAIADGLLDIKLAPGVSAYDAEINRLFN